MKLHRRDFMKAIAGVIPLAGPASIQAAPSTPPIPIIDTHIHLFDPRRPQGVPWPPKTDKILYRPALPDRYQRVTQGLGIVGAIEIECSPWLQDNQWVLNVAARNKIIVGTVSDLEPGTPAFRKQLEHFHRNPLFRGIRYGNLWGRNLAAQLSRPAFVSDLKFLADAGMELDTANPDPVLIATVVRLTDQVPSLLVVIDHFPQLQFPVEKAARKTLESNLRALGKRPQVYIKVSELVHDSPLPRQFGFDSSRMSDRLNFYRSILDVLWDTFGEDRLMYGSDWPNSDHSAPFREEFKVVSEYFANKGRTAQEKFFWRNSIAAYHWVKRDPSQNLTSGAA